MAGCSADNGEGPRCPRGSRRSPRGRRRSDGPWALAARSPSAWEEPPIIPFWGHGEREFRPGTETKRKAASRERRCFVSQTLLAPR